MRSSFADTRKYYNAQFPYAKVELDKAVKAKLLEDAEDKIYPPFGTKAWPAPVHLKAEEIGEDKGSESEPDDDEDPRPFKKRRQYKARKETRWVLTDRKKKNVLYGHVEAQSARYYVMIPPPQSNPSEPFRMVPVHEWVEFKKPPNYHTLSVSEVKKLQDSKASMSNVAKFLESRQRMRDEEMEKMGSHEAMRKGAPRQPSFKKEANANADGDELLMSDDDAEIRTNKKMRGRDVGLENDSDGGNDEEDIDVLAIDRQDAGRGEGTGDADYQQEFQDDEDDGAILQEEEQLHNNEEDLIDGAEDLQEAISDDEEDSDDEFAEDEDEDAMEEDDDDEDNSRARVGRTPLDAQREREQAEAEARAKVVKEGNDASGSGANTSADGSAATSSTGAGGDAAGNKSGQPGEATASSSSGAAGSGASKAAAGSSSGKRKPATGVEAFRAAILEIMRSEGGTIDIEKLLKTGTKKKLLKQVGFKKQEAQQHLSTIVKDVAIVGNDPISGAMQAKLKQEYI